MTRPHPSTLRFGPLLLLPLLALPTSPAGAASLAFSPAYPGQGPAFEGWRPLTRRYLGVLVGRALQRYQRALEYPSVDAPEDVAEADLGPLVRALAAGTMRATDGRFQPQRPVSRLELALTLDRLGQACRGWPERISSRRFPWPRDLPGLAAPVRQAMDRVLRLRLLRADEGLFWPRMTASRYEALVALDRLLTVLGTRPSRPPVDYPDVPPAHYARLAIRDLYGRGLLGAPVIAEGQTRLDPPPHRIRGPYAPTLPLAERPFRPRTELDLATSELPGARRLDELGARLQEEETRRVLLEGAWDRLRVEGRASGDPRVQLLNEVTEHRRQVGRIHLALGRLVEDLPVGPRDSLASQARASLGPEVNRVQGSAKDLYRRLTSLRDQVLGTVAVPLPGMFMPPLPLAARGTPVAGLLVGGLVGGERQTLDDELLLVPEGPPPRGSAPPLPGARAGAGGRTEQSLPGEPRGEASGDGMGDSMGDDLGDDLGMGDDPMEGPPGASGGSSAGDPGSAPGGEPVEGELDDLGDLDDLGL